MQELPSLRSRPGDVTDVTRKSERTQASRWKLPFQDPSSTGISAWEPARRSPASAKYKPLLKLYVPLKGIVFMTPTEEAKAYAEINGVEPVYDQLFEGFFEATLQPDSPPLRIKDIRVGIRVESKLDLGPGRNGEIDELLSREEHYASEDGSEVILYDTLKFSFAFTIPSDTAPRDFHPNGVVASIVYAEMIGQPIEGEPSIPEKYPVFYPSFPSVIKSTQAPSLLELASSWIPFGRSKHAQNDSSTVTKVSLPTEIPDSKEAVWLEGSHSVAMVVRLAYNPNPNGGITVLNEIMQGHLPHVGPYHIRLFSDVWTITSLIQATLALVELDPRVTIFNFRVILAQTHRIQSPRDGPLNAKEIVKTRKTVLLEEGSKPETHQGVPSEGAPALWRGKEAGGDDDGPFILETFSGQRQDDLNLRPSTTPGLMTPIFVSHELEVQVYFSVLGYDERGRSGDITQEGGLQCLRIRRKTMLPNCLLVPSILDLPDYDHPTDIEKEDPEGLRVHCACEMSLESVIARMQAAAREEESQAEESKAALSAKQEAERRLRT